MEDEAAEIELLEQNLNKTRQISQRMISILTNFDTRLVKVEKSILPLHNSTQLLNRRAANIESTLELIDEVASSQQGLAEEEALILRGPQATQLNTYIDALERMNASIAFKGASEESMETARLVEAGAKKLAQLYTKYVAEASSGTPPTRSSLDGNTNGLLVPFSEDIIQSLLPIVQFLRTLPVPATHPSHPAAEVIQSALLDAQRGYADMRGTWIRKCLEAGAKRVVEGREAFGSSRETDTADVAIREGQEFTIWVEGVIGVAESEYSALSDLAVLVSSSQLSGTFASLITPLLTLLSSALSQLTNRVKRSLQQNTFLALSAYAFLARPQTTARWDEAVRRRASGSTANVNALKEGLHSLRAVCLRSFPEFIADVKLSAVPKVAVEIGTDVADITETVLKYMTAIPAVQDAVGSALLTLGDGNWKMGDGVQVNKGPKLGEGDETVIIEHYFYDVVMTTLTTLTTLSRTSRRPAIGSVFLLNNVSYFVNSLLFSEETSPVEVLLATPTRNALQSAFRTAKAGYFDANFSPLLQVLGDGPGSGGGSGKAGVKEKFTRFFDLFDDIVERHRVIKVLPDDKQGRESLAEEAHKLVVPSLQRFIQKNKDFSKNPQKYIRISPEELEKQIKRLY